MADIIGVNSYKDRVRKLEPSDLGVPETWDPIHTDLINNDVYLKGQVDLVKDKLEGKGTIHTGGTKTITSNTGIITLTEESNSFLVLGSEDVTVIRGWESGIAIIRWNMIRTLINSNRLILLGDKDRKTNIGDIGVYEITADFAREITYSSSNIENVDNNLKRNTTYAVGDIAYHKDLPSWARLECVQAGTTGDTIDFTQISRGGI